MLSEYAIGYKSLVYFFGSSCSGIYPAGRNTTQFSLHTKYDCHKEEKCSQPAGQMFEESYSYNVSANKALRCNG